MSSECTEVNALCPVSDTVYGYYPNLPANAFFLAVNAALLVANIPLALKYKTWMYSFAVAAGCLLEVVGYSGRLIMHSNPYNTQGFIMQICCLILGPAFFSGGIYLTLKHFTKAYGREYSIIQPRLYTWIFISCDLISLTLQAAGGGVSSSAADGDVKTLNLGSNLAIAGIVFQVFTLLMFGLLAVLYVVRRWQARATRASPLPETQTTLFKAFVAAIVLAYLTIFIRCVYRIAEMAGGWGNSLMQNETEFIALDSVMVLIAALALTLFHPGYCFPSMAVPLKWRRSSSKPSLAGEKMLESPSDSDGSGPGHVV